MKWCFLIIVLAAVSCQNKPDNKVEITKAECTDSCCNKTSSGLSCKLTTKEMQQRKATVIASLKKQMLEKKELPDGYKYKFVGTDKMLDELTEFIKTERQCCDFFTFDLSIAGNGKDAWLQITGPNGAKDFIISEFEL